jgi:hypothetical protein
MKGASTAAALTTAVEFFRFKGITLDNIRMDNQSSPEFKTAAANLGLTPNLVASMQKEGNRSERAIQTAKNHIISIRAGFHRDCPTSYLDKCVAQIEMTMNVMHPYEYDPQLSAYDGIFKHSFDFMTHPIAPLGSKVLTWDSPEKRGSWADHGTSGIYVGPAMDHFRAFRIWVPETSAMRTSATVWWFFPSFHPDDNLTTLQNIEVSYPPTRERHNPQRNGSDLLGRYFFDPDIGVCCITRLGPVTRKQLPSRAQLRSQATPDLTIAVGTHYTLYYQCTANGEEHYSSVDEILQWIKQGPILQPPAITNHDASHISAPPYAYPITVMPPQISNRPDVGPQRLTQPEPPTIQHDQQQQEPSVSEHITTPNDTLELQNTTAPKVKSRPNQHQGTRVSTRPRALRDFLKPTHHGKAYHTGAFTNSPRKQRVPSLYEYREKQRVSVPDTKRKRREFLWNSDPAFPTTLTPSAYSTMYHRYKRDLKLQKDKRIGWSDVFDDLSPSEIQQLFTKLVKKRPHGTDITSQHQIGSEHHKKRRTGFVSTIFDAAMPKPQLPPVYPNRPLNLNEDGTIISYKKSHTGPYAQHWLQADAEEMERLFVSGTLRPIRLSDIPPGKTATYVNPVCSEKLRDAGDIKFRTRATIGGDQVDYPYETTAVTANLESIKILFNAMISDDIQLATIDLEDFYLGTPLPHAEYIRIPVKFIPPKVIAFYKLQPFLHKGALYCAVLKTHYGLPQAGALSQQRLFKHLAEHGYHQLKHSPSLFRNSDGSIRFALVVDDFAVIWKDKARIKHFIQTLRLLYTVKVDWNGSKYLGMDIAIDRPHRHVTLSMPGYIEKLLRRIRPSGVKGAATPSIYQPPNYKSPKAQTATIDASDFATADQKHELQVVVGTLLYYARTVDPSILTAVHELGSVQANPTINDMKKVERLLQYVSTHQKGATRFYASSMQLQVQSDASYLCRPKARSVLGGHHYLGFPDRINGPIFCTSKIISCVVASVAEAELGAAFQNAQKAAEFRNTLHEIGYPQNPTTIMIDNTVAEGLAADTINARRSKSMDVRFFWLRDRIQRGQFKVQHLAGRWNISDFFTKSLPKDKFMQFFAYLVVNLDLEVQAPRLKRITVTMAKTPL